VSLSVRPASLALAALLLLLLILACGGGADPSSTEPQQDLSGSSLSDLLGNEPVPAQQEPAPAQQQPAQAQAVAEPRPLQEPVLEEPPEEPLGGVAQEETPETEECQAARARLKEERARVDERRGPVIAAAERNLNASQDRFNQCLKGSGPCSQDAEAISQASARAKQAEAAYSAALQRIGEMEAALYPLEQDVDRACGRR